MIDQAVLAAVAAAVDRGGDLDRALAELRRVDPLLRGAARRRLRAAHADALLSTPIKQGPEAGCHALRLTYLLIARAIPSRAARGDVAAIEAAFTSARASRRPARQAPWWPSGIAAITVLAAGAAGVAAAAHPSSPPAPLQSSAASPSAPPVPPMRGAFAEGGAPARLPGDAAVARALATDLPDYLTALDRRSEARQGGHPEGDAGGDPEAEMRAAKARALSPEVRDALGPAGAQALEALFSAASAAAEANAPSRGPGLAEAVAAFDDALAASGLGYFLDGDVITEAEDGRRLVLVYSFRVARVGLYASGTTTVRALRLRRLDHLNWSPTLLGFTRPTLRVAAVLLDQLDEQVVARVAPGLADGASVPLFDPDAPAEERAAVEARAGELLREEYGALPGLDRIAAVKLGKLLGKRGALVTRWEKLASARGLVLRAPTGLRLPEGFAKSIERLVPRDDLEDLALIQAALDDQTREDAFLALRDALASSVERHEVQHRLDAAGLEPPPMPAALEALVGPLGRPGDEGHLAAAARDELSAYLAELSRDPRTPRVGLALLSRFLFDRRLHGTPESYAALTILEGLGKELGKAPRPLLHDGAVDRRAASALWLDLVAGPPQRLRDAAATLWASLFSKPLPDLHPLAPPG
jgi:hypothetical protein